MHNRIKATFLGSSNYTNMLESLNSLQTLIQWLKGTNDIVKFDVHDDENLNYGKYQYGNHKTQHVQYYIRKRSKSREHYESGNTKGIKSI